MSKVRKIQAFVLSGYYRFRMKHTPFEGFSRSIGIFMHETPSKALTPEELRNVYYIRRDVLYACNKTPWESKCMVQALTAKHFLNKSGFPCTLYMGVKNDESSNLIAHAWLRCGNVIVTGEEGHEEFTVTGTYGDK